MRKLLLALIALLSSPAWPDTLITNVNGIQSTPDGKLQHFTGLLVGDDGRVKDVLNGPRPMVAYSHMVDGGGRTLLPGLIDAHGHVLGLGFSAIQLDLVGTNSLADLQQRLRVYAAAHPEARWIIGRGWNQELWPDKRFPTAADLDAVVSDRPVVLERVDGHALVANSAAMKAAGVTQATPAPPGGRIENGLFVDNAKGLVEKAVPAPSPQDMDVAFQKSQDILLGFGVTGVGAMSTSLEDWNTCRRAGEAGGLKVRLMAYALNGPLPEVPHPTPWLYGDKLRMVGAKFFADGALGSRGAWLKQPYEDKPDTRGL